jgi:hypothetical protein
MFPVKYELNYDIYYIDTFHALRGATGSTDKSCG